jgi:hypothetical protein
MTTVTLKNVFLIDFTGFCVVTSWAPEAIGPPKPKQSSTTFIIVSILAYAIRDAHAFLKLNLIFGHADTSYLGRAITNTISMAVNKRYFFRNLNLTSGLTKI